MADLAGAGDERPVRRGVALPVTSARDGLEHLVADESMTPENAGRYVALCGRTVWAAALACPAGKPCSACIAVRRLAVVDGRRRERTDRHGMWARLTTRLRRQPRARHAVSSRASPSAGTGEVPDAD